MDCREFKNPFKLFIMKNEELTMPYTSDQKWMKSDGKEQINVTIIKQVIEYPYIQNVLEKFSDDPII